MAPFRPGLECCQVVLAAADPPSHSYLPSKDSQDSEHCAFSFVLQYFLPLKAISEH